MIGKTNSQTGGAIKGEKLNISLKTNQASHDDLIGAIITVTHPGGTTQYTWDGSIITANIPPHVAYTVSYSDVEGYKTPETYERDAAVPENSLTLEAEYLTEVVSVTLEADNGASMDGAKVTVNGVNHTWDGTAITQKVPFGTIYSVVPQALSGYSTPASQTGIVASQSSRNWNVAYVPRTERKAA